MTRLMTKMKIMKNTISLTFKKREFFYLVFILSINSSSLNKEEILINHICYKRFKLSNFNQ